LADEERQSLVPEQVGVKTIPTDSLAPNPHNPRVLFDRAPLRVLRESIEKVGILVPLTVYWSEAQQQYIILDGQRRWICAQELDLSTVPVNVVAEPSLVQNIVTMFQIHKFREDWELMPTALKLEVLMKELDERKDSKLAALTGLDRAVVVRCRKLLSYPREFQDLMLHPDPAKRVKADFFIELYTVRNDRFVNKMAWFSRESFTRRMLDKYRSRAGSLKSVTDFRIMKQHINNARHAKQEEEISRRLHEFTEDDSLPLSHLAIRSADVSAGARSLIGSIRRIEEAIRAIDVPQYYGEEELWTILERLLVIVRQKLAAADRRVQQ
jgi:ParB/RepB/Spo0J family partition protein